MYYHRNLLTRLKKALGRSPVVLLIGARQTGKTTLAMEVASDLNMQFVSFDELSHLGAASHDPVHFISGLSGSVVLDEIQRVPELFLPIKRDVDLHRRPGRYLLTGSANPLLLPKVSDSLAGRMEILHLYPFSQGELISHEEKFLEKIFSETFPHFQGVFLEKEMLAEMLIMGGYPEIQKFQNEEDIEAWCNSYLITLLQKDVQDLANIGGLVKLPNVLKLLATRVGNLMNGSELARATGIPNTTLHRYLNLLQTLFILDFLSPWSLNLGKRLVKSPKTYLSDTALLCYLLGANRKRLLSRPEMIGHILENFVLSELKKQACWSKERIDFYHFRTQTGIEVDIIAENAAGEVVGIEVKSSGTVTSADFQGLRHLKQTIKGRFHRGIVLYCGADMIAFGDRLLALPLSLLWNCR